MSSSVVFAPLSNSPPQSLEEKLPPNEIELLPGAALTELPNPGLYAGTMIPASTRLQNMIKNCKRTIVCPGVYDGLSARTALEVGFEALYMVSFDDALHTSDQPQTKIYHRLVQAPLPLASAWLISLLPRSQTCAPTPR
jgi:hypothetical protein